MIYTSNHESDQAVPVHVCCLQERIVVLIAAKESHAAVTRDRLPKIHKVLLVELPKLYDFIRVIGLGKELDGKLVITGPEHEESESEGVHICFLIEVGEVLHLVAGLIGQRFVELVKVGLVLIDAFTQRHSVPVMPKRLDLIL
jgi:hypothetical protein